MRSTLVSLPQTSDELASGSCTIALSATRWESLQSESDRLYYRCHTISCAKTFNDDSSVNVCNKRTGCTILFALKCMTGWSAENSKNCVFISLCVFLGQAVTHPDVLFDSNFSICIKCYGRSTFGEGDSDGSKQKVHRGQTGCTPFFGVWPEEGILVSCCRDVDKIPEEQLAVCV
jgi:hypothetical protein